MIEYTYQQKIAIVRILLDIIHADGIIHERETFFLNMLKEEFNLNNDDDDVVKEKNSLIALTQIKFMSVEQKNELAVLMSKMIIVDEDVNANEVAIYDVVADFCGIKVSFEEIVGKDQLGDCSKSE